MVLNPDNLHNQVRALLEEVSGGATESVDFTELPEPIYMPGTLVCYTLPVQKEGFSIYDYIGG